MHKICVSFRSNKAFTDSDPPYDADAEIDKTLIDELHRRVPPPESTVADNRKLREQWIKMVVRCVDDLEDKIKFMEGIRITKLKDTLQQPLDCNRIKQIFKEYKSRRMFYVSHQLILW